MHTHSNSHISYLHAIYYNIYKNIDVWFFERIQVPFLFEISVYHPEMDDFLLRLFKKRKRKKWKRWDCLLKRYLDSIFNNVAERRLSVQTHARTHTYRNTHMPCFQTWNFYINEQLAKQNRIIGIIKKK